MAQRIERRKVFVSCSLTLRHPETAGQGFLHILKTTMKRTCHRLDSNSHHATCMKAHKSADVPEAWIAQESFSFSLPCFPPGIPQLNLGMLVYVPQDSPKNPPHAHLTRNPQVLTSCQNKLGLQGPHMSCIAPFRKCLRRAPVCINKPQ